MKKITFKNNVLNAILGVVLLVAGIIELIGAFGVDNLDYISPVLQYVTGCLVMLFGLFNMFKTIKKTNTKGSNLLSFGINIVIMVLGFLAIIPTGSLEIVFSPVNALGATIYLEGVFVVLNSSIKNEKTKRILLGIIIITIGVVVITLIKQEHIIYGLAFIMILLGLIFFISSLSGMSKSKKENKTDEKGEETKSKRDRKAKREEKKNKKR